MMLDYNYPEERLEKLCLAFQEQSEEWRDAAEFEARVAKKLTEQVERESNNNFRWPYPAHDALKLARLAAEEEMDNEMDN